MAEPVNAHPLGEPATVRVAMWSSRHRWPVAAGWFLGTIGLFVLTVVINGMRTDVAELLPMSMKVADMVPDDPGSWLFHCHVNDHITAGMLAQFAVN